MTYRKTFSRAKLAANKALLTIRQFAGKGMVALGVFSITLSDPVAGVSEIAEAGLCIL